MDPYIIRTQKDCQHFSDFIQIRKFTNMLNALQNHPRAKKELRSFMLDLQPRIANVVGTLSPCTPNIIMFFKYMAYACLDLSLKRFLTKEMTTTTVPPHTYTDLMEAYKRFWNTFIRDDEPVKESEIREYIAFVCDILSRHCYHKDEPFVPPPDRGSEFQCYNCIIDNLYIGIGRPEHMCSKGHPDDIQISCLTDFKRTIYEGVCNHFIDMDTPTEFDRLLTE